MIPFYIVDAFAEKAFSGNPAGVCLLEQWLPDEAMQAIAKENNQSETAFMVKTGDKYELRWFTPVTEIDLCGHATLASAFVLSRFVAPNAASYTFLTKSGPLTVTRQENMLEMDFPSRPPASVSISPQVESAMQSRDILSAYAARDLVLLFPNENCIKNLTPDMEQLRALDASDIVIATAAGRGETDFVCRCFAPRVGIPEDPVTGSAHSTLIPFWAHRLGKETLVSRQLSQRGGVLHCKNDGDRVKIAGYARLYMQGKIAPLS